MHLITCEDGESFDLHTNRGAYEYVGRFLRMNAADSQTFSCLGRLCPDSSDVVRINKKVLFTILKSHNLLSQAEYNRNPGYNNTHPSHIAEEKMIVELEKLGIFKEFLST